MPGCGQSLAGVARIRPHACGSAPDPYVPKEARTVDQQTTYMFQLAQQLNVHGIAAQVGLLITEPTTGIPLITCMPRPDDEGRLWFFVGEAIPLAEADRITDAVMAVKAHIHTTP